MCEFLHEIKTAQLMLYKERRSHHKWAPLIFYVNEKQGFSVENMSFGYVCIPASW